MNKKLNLKWVAESIGEEYKKWKKGDIVTIQAQTGTGKTYFIKKCLIHHMKDYEKLLYICNRINLKRQLKKDLLEQFNRPIPYITDEKSEYILDKNNNKILDVLALDKISKIGNVTITSYHSIQKSALNSDYDLGSCHFDYDYIVMDECHYLLTDGSFNSQVRIAFDRLIVTRSSSVIKILISATMDELEYPIEYMCDMGLGKKLTPWKYKTGIDYSYVNTKYFTAMKDIITTIHNDKSDEKWLIFVTNLNDAMQIQEEFGKNNVSIIKAGTTTDELNNIISNSKFNCRILCATKAMDNGINISDTKLTNIVIMSWDKITFIQMLGRKRIDIDDAQEINLYISTRYKKSFKTKLREYKYKESVIDLFKNELNQFNRNYDNDLDKLGKMKDLFYRDNKTKEWGLNIIGHRRLQLDIEAFEEIVLEFDKYGMYAFILKQLEWLELGDTFDKTKYLKDVMLNDEVQSLENYLENMFNKKNVLLRAIDRKELIEKINLIDGSHSNLKENKINYVKNINTLKSHLQDTLKSRYQIEEFPHSKTINGKTTRYKASWRVNKIIV